LSLTEEDQRKALEKPGTPWIHMCMKYNKQLKHGSHHPTLMAAEECNGAEVKDLWDHLQES
jgi:hypothetical protein